MTEVDPPCLDGFEFRSHDSWGLELEGLVPGTFCRVDPAVLPALPLKLRELAWCTSGAVIRFRLRGGRFALRLGLGEFEPMPHMPLTGQAGLDVYLGRGRAARFWQNFRPEPGQRAAEGVCQLPAGDQEVTLYLPLYAPVRSVELGFPAEDSPLPPGPYARAEPLALYGSSITQGACAARPGSCYAAILARAVNCGLRNLGFSGSAKGEPELADYLAGQPMCALVYDYDFNAPDAAHLRRTHCPFLERVLDKRPDLPVLIASRPNYGREGEDAQRRQVVLETYLWALSAGARVEFVDGAALFGGLDAGACTVDGIHPTDLGFHQMAAAMEPALRRLLAGGGASV